MAFNPRAVQSEMRKDWLEHEYTLRVRKEAQDDIRRALAKLVNVARDTTDARVAKALGEYEHFVKLSEFLTSHGEAAAE